MFRKRRLFTAAVAAALIIATGLSAGAKPTDEGFLLTGADAAYADWNGVGLDGCTGGDLFVGFVQADGLQLPLAMMPQPHSDVQAILSNLDCAGVAVPELEGTVQATFCDDAFFVSLDETDPLDKANFDCPAFTIDNAVVGGVDSALVTIALSWAAKDDIFRETFHSRGSHAAHITRLADVGGGVTITGTAGALILGGVKVGGVVGGDVQDARITHFQEIRVAPLP